ncbi:hypothetical protein CCICO_09265 [Corynebacterium ciconiae DSM 44920]|nr:hypothetical protein CCICO_09265 [Corynebacterium ciconiae DSM 44920]
MRRCELNNLAVLGILNDTTTSFTEGVHALIGPSGAGKTTFCAPSLDT